MTETLDLDKLSSFSVIQLRSELSKRGLQLSGMKADLLARLQSYQRSDVETAHGRNGADTTTCDESITSLSQEDDEYIVLEEYVSNESTEDLDESFDELRSTCDEVLGCPSNSRLDNNDSSRKRGNPVDTCFAEDNLSEVKKKCHIKSLDQNDHNADSLVRLFFST